MNYPNSVPGVGLVGGKFTDGNPLLGQPASLDPSAWANQVTDELLSVIAAAGIAPSEVASNQLLLALRAAGVFTTPAQFDVSTKAATMDAVQRALGNIRGFAVGGVNRALTVADVGSAVLVSPGVTLTLPLANSVPSGSVIHFRTSAGGADRAVVASGGDTISVGTGSAAVLRDGDTLSLASNGSNAWINVGGIAGLGSTLQFGSSLAANGYKKTPDASSPTGFIIEQWGVTGQLTSGQVTTLTLPIAMPNTVLAAACAPASNVAITANYTGAVGNFSSASFSIAHYSAGGTAAYRWRVIGY